MDTLVWGDTPQARYHREPGFRTLVDMMEHMVHSSRYSPSELREAAVLASIHYEMRVVRQYHVRITPKIEAHFKALHTLVEGAVAEQRA